MRQEGLFSREDQLRDAKRDLGHISEKSLRELKESLPSLSSIEGAPSEIEKILGLSLPPFYTASPNPFLANFLNHRGNEDDRVEAVSPLTEDISVGKNDPLYFAHYYSTKVPPRAIIPYILHYTEPGDVVFDGFCGTGMTGVAAQLCGEPLDQPTTDGKVGARRAVLVDLSPAATFIAAMTNSIALLATSLDKLEAIVEEVAEKERALLHTRHVGWRRGETDPAARKNAREPRDERPGHIEYVVWSDVFHCSDCGTELVFWDLVFRGPKQPAPKPLSCPNCGAVHSLRTLERAWVTRYDHELRKTVRQAKQVPVLVNYSVGNRRFEKYPDEEDLSVLARLEEASLPSETPIFEMPQGFNTAQPRASHGFTHVHHFFTRRNLLLMSMLWERFKAIDDPTTRCGALFLLTGMVQRVCRLNRYMPLHDRHVGPLSGTLYVSQLTAEIPATNYALDRIQDLRRCSRGPSGEGVRISTQSATDLRNVPDHSVDYVFTDPPFGGNLNYSELNTLVEAWIEIRTDAKPEAVVNEVQRKGLREYQDLMDKSFQEFYRVLKPGRWMTVEFHNSQNAVWNAIQEGLWEAGFIIADVRTLDKQKGTTKQLSYGTAVKQDLIISAYKPNRDFEKRFEIEAGAEEGVWDFVRTHLAQLPTFVSTNGRAEVIVERMGYLLFDRMVAFHVQRGVTVPISAAGFYAGLKQRYPEREGMYFTPDQVAEYDRKRITVREMLELSLFVTDEQSALQWLEQRLARKPQTFQELHPQFMKEIGGWQKHEKRLELSDLLEQNFLRYDGAGEVPGQIHGYLSSNFKGLRSLPKDHPELQLKAKDRWYLPDPNKAGDLEKLRERTLLKEFREYKDAKQTLRVIRLEAVRAGFKNAWGERDYTTILDVAGKIPETVLQEDPKLLMWYDQALARTER